MGLVKQADAYRNALELIRGARRVLILTHVNPDGDAIGSASAMATAVRAQGKQVDVVLFSPLPKRYEMIFDVPPVIFSPPVARWLDRYDLCIIVDTSIYGQLSPLAEPLKAARFRKLVLDHHLSSEPMGDVQIVEPDVAAAAVLVVRLFDAAGWTISARQADALFLALSTDTGYFRFSNTTAGVFQLAARLVSAGARPDELYRVGFQSYSLQRFRLHCMALQTLELACDDRLAMLEVTPEMFRRSGAECEDTENLINEPLQIGSVEEAVLFVAQPDGRRRASFRSKRGLVDVNALAGMFGGGGHARAAGANLDVPIAQAKHAITQAVCKLLSGQRASSQ